mgnify:CR=1 FL=1
MTLSPKRFVVFMAFSCCVFSLIAFAQSWPQWRGPNRDGFTADEWMASNWPDSLTTLWRVQVGAGYGSPVAQDGKAWLLTRRDELEYVSCFDLKNGNVLWQQSYPAPFNTNQYATRFGKGPFSTPTLADGRLYTLGVGGIVTCFDAETGEVLWRKSFTDGPPDSKTFFSGSSMAPLIDGERCIVHIGDDSYGALTAYHKETGAEIWKWQGDNPGYASPIVVEIDGVRQIVTLAQSHVIGVAVQTGELLWKIPFTSEWRENMPTPVLYNGMVIYSGVGRGVTAVTPKRGASGWTIEQQWHTDEVGMYMSSPVLVGDLLFGLSHFNKGQFFCLDAGSGKVLWLSEGRQGQNASIVKSGDFLLCLTTEAVLSVAKADSAAFQPVKSYRVAGSPTWATPVYFENKILLKDRDSLMLLQKTN